VKRRASSTGAAATVLAAAAWLAAAGCLNPRPEELPSEGDIPGLAGNLDDDPVDSANPTDTDNATPTAPIPSPGASEAPPSGEEGIPADAGAPDAGSRAAESCTDAEPSPETGEPPE
jgi:hypothetical protein